MRLPGLRVLADLWRAQTGGWLLAAVALAWGPPAHAEVPILLDDFEEASPWEARPAEGVVMTLGPAAGASGRAMRLDYDFRGRGGWAAARRHLPLELPDNWELALTWKGVGARQTLEVKLLDPTGENVWWAVRRDVRAPQKWQQLVLKKRHFSFAWGPAGGGELRQVGYVEFAVTASEGGAGEVWFDTLTLTPLPPPQPYRGTPVLQASASAAGSRPELAMDGSSSSAWRSRPEAGGEAWLEVEFGQRRELGGLVITWGEGSVPAAYAVELSPDGARWATAWQVAAVHPRRSWVPLPEAEARRVRLSMRGVPPGGVAVAELEVKPLEFSATPNEFIAAVARQARRGVYPRGLRGEMTAWTVVGGSPGGRWRGLLSADGAFEPAPKASSLEPFIWLDGRLLTWADVEISQSLLDGSLPIPTVRWSHPTVSLEVTALVAEGPAPATWLHYRVANHGEGAVSPALLLTVRPWQVNPPSQFLNIPGGVAEEQTLTITSHLATLQPANLYLLPQPVPSSFGAVPFDGGDIIAYLEGGELPLTAPHGPYPSGAWRWDLDLPAGGTAEVVVLVPHLKGDQGFDPQRWLGSALSGGDGPAAFASQRERTARRWRERLGRVAFRLPRQAQELLDTARANEAFILINRDGPALEPGARAYRRSWIRDGAMMAAALLRLGHAQEVKDFARWYAGFQYDDGKVPCCVDHRGADPVPEHDSHGQFIFLAAETLRITGDRAFAAELWPRVEAAGRAIDALRAQRRTADYQMGETRRFYGLLPESISHEGYAAKPMHSYWDNFWALRGLADAAWLAQELGAEESSRHWARSAHELRDDLLASLAATMAHHGIDYLPGCAELGDFDPTSTTVALSPAGIAHWLPRTALERTFGEYWQRFAARRDGLSPWREFTPYELRAVGSFLRLGWRAEAWELLEWFSRHRQPSTWRQWPEIVWSDPVTARFVGDLPHAWVGSDFLRAFLDLFAYERAEDETLVLAAGLPPAWLASGEEIAVLGLATYYGPLTYSVRAEEGKVHLRLEAGVRLPPGGVVVALPGIPAGWEARVNGRRVRASPLGHFAVFEVPFDLVVTWPARVR